MAGTTNERIKHSEGRLRHSPTYLEDRPGVIGGYHVRKATMQYEHLARKLRDDVAYARAQAAVVDASKEVWDRADAITEDGKLLAERIEGFIQRIQLDPDVQGELDLIEDTRTTLALDPDDPDQFSAIRQNAAEIASEIARVEGNLNSDNPTVWYSSIKQTAEEITSEIGRVEGNLNSNDRDAWYSSIKQTADEIESVVGILNLTPEDEDWDTLQYSSIKQTATEIESVVATLNLTPDDPDWTTKQYSSIKQTVDEISQFVVNINESEYDFGEFSSFSQTANAIIGIVAKLEGDPDDADQFSSIIQLFNEIDLRVKSGQIIAAINLSTEGVRILGERIQLDGDVSIDGTFKVAGKHIELDGDTTIKGDFLVSGENIKLDGDVEVDGSFTVNGAVNISPDSITADRVAVEMLEGNLDLGSLGGIEPLDYEDYTVNHDTLASLTSLPEFDTNIMHAGIYRTPVGGDVSHGTVQIWILNVTPSSFTVRVQNADPDFAATYSIPWRRYGIKPTTS